MKTRVTILWAVCTVLIPTAHAQTKEPMRLIQTMPLPDVERYFDHMAVDVKGQRLFVTGQYKRTLEVMDLRTGKVSRAIAGFGGDPGTAIYLAHTHGKLS